MTRCILAVDPGLSGALCFYFPNFPERAAAEDLPVVNKEINAAAFAERVRQMDPELAVIELVSAMPKQGVVSTFRFGTAFGVVTGVISALQIPLHRVSPRKWKSHYNLSSDKEQARALACRLFPAVPQHFTRVRDHNKAEAALIAKYLAFTLGLERAPT